MITYAPLWATMKRRGISTYTLREKYGISASTVQRLQKNLSVSTNTLDQLCSHLHCDLSGVVEYHREAEE